MTPAEFRTHRESLGLDAAWLAERLGVHVNMVYRYESASRSLDVPDRVADEVRDLLNDFEAAVERLALEQEAPEVEVLSRYWDQQAFWRATPELKGWPLLSQGMLLAEVMRVHGRDLRVDYEL